MVGERPLALFHGTGAHQIFRDSDLQTTAFFMKLQNASEVYGMFSICIHVDRFLVLSICANKLPPVFIYSSRTAYLGSLMDKINLPHLFLVPPSWVHSFK